MDFRTEHGGFTEEFKRSVVLEVESGKRNIKELNIAYGIQGHSTILKWCRRYGGNQYSVMQRTKTEVPPIGKEDQSLLLKNQVAVLERELREARLKQATLETLIDIAERRYSIVIKKTLVGNN